MQAARQTADMRVETISSPENRWLKMFRVALVRGRPTEEGFIGVEGPRLVEEAIRAQLELAALLASPAGEKHLARWLGTLGPGVRLLRTTEKLFATVTSTKAPQGIAALVRPPAWNFEDLLRGDVPLVVVLAGVQDPGNVGTMIRTAEALGATGVVAARLGEQNSANPLAPKALRASAGSALRMPVLAGISLPTLLVQLRVSGVRIYAASAASGVPPAELDFRVPVALLIGNEGAGLPPEAERSADALACIPLTGSLAAGGAVDSLNAAVAAAILLYEAARQRKQATR
jgi:TrmH family RNA methyltransferase